MQFLHLRGRKICDRLMRQGRVWKGKHMNVRWMEGYPRHPSARPRQAALYVGTLASTKLDKSAVKRNRMRRRCREALRLLAPGIELSGSFQLLLAPRSSSLQAPFEELQQDVRAFLSSLSYGRSKASQ